MTSWLSIAAGLVILTVGAEFLLRGATAVARRFGLSELLIGLTLVGFGTSTPELVSSVQAALVGSPGVAVGNVVGSNIANTLLILGLSAALAPFAVEPKSFRRDSAVVAFATLLAVALAYTGEYGRLAGGIFLAFLVAYIAFAYLSERKEPSAPETERHEEEAAALPAGPKALWLDGVFIVGGLAALMVGARFLVTGAIDIASNLGVSETIIGLTVVAVGTSLPELFTSVMAALRGKSEIALGNVVGSNIYNLLGILGATALVQPIAVPAEIVAFDNWVMVGATAAMILFARTQRRVDRWEGLLLMGAYVAYVAWLAMKAAAA